MKIILTLISLSIFVHITVAQDNFLRNLMESNPEQFADILQNQQKYEKTAFNINFNSVSVSHFSTDRSK